MTSRANPKQKVAGEFPALRQLFSGYLHQDFLEEYESAAAAAKAFRQDAAWPQVAAAKKEWNAWRKRLGQCSLEEAASAIRKLGGAWAPQSLAELDQFGKSLEN